MAGLRTPDTHTDSPLFGPTRNPVAADQVVPRKGVVVRHLSRRDVEELFDVREALEVLATRRAAERATAEELAALRRARGPTPEPRRSRVSPAPFSSYRWQTRH